MIQTVLGVDYGLKRVGVAIGNTLTRHAEPLTIIMRSNDEQVLQQIATLIREWQVQAIAIGIPRQPDDTPHAMTSACAQFAEQLRQRFGLPVHPTDERYSSAVLPQRHKRRANGQIRATAQDDAAAAVILQQHLDQAHD
ncbi:MAG: Holliday junction resolvase RuvX [Formosimonas sp.]